MNIKTHTKTAGRPGPFTRTEAEEFAASLGSSIMILGIIRENDGWYVSYAQKITTTLILCQRMKRYLLFAGDHYTSLGWNDLFKGDFDTVEEARRAIGGPDMSPTDWFEIIDTDTKKVVETDTVYCWLENREG